MRRLCLALVVTIASVATLPLVVHGQAPASTTDLFRSGVDLVALDLCVRDRDGHFVPRLDPRDLEVLEDNVPQTISFVWPGDRVPVAVTLLLDRSSSMEGDPIKYAREAAMRFVDGLGPDDELSIIAFGRRAQLLTTFGDDRSTASSAILTAEASGTTALYDAVLVALDDIAKARRSRTREMRDVILVLSDGDDTASVNAFDEVKAAARRSDVLFYAVAIREQTPVPGFTRNTAPTWPLTSLAAETGGAAVSAPALDQLPAVFGSILEEISHLYRVGYVSTNTKRDGSWRKVSVRVAGNGVVVRTRAGYLAPRGPR